MKVKNYPKPWVNVQGNPNYWVKVKGYPRSWVKVRGYPKPWLKVKGLPYVSSEGLRPNIEWKCKIISGLEWKRILYPRSPPSSSTVAFTKADNANQSKPRGENELNFTGCLFSWQLNNPHHLIDNTNMIGWKHIYDWLETEIWLVENTNTIGWKHPNS